MSTDTSLDITELVNIDESVVCDFIDACESEATYVGVGQPCGHQVLLCDVHYEDSKKLLDDYLNGRHK
jgi:hypothetical protein